MLNILIGLLIGRESDGVATEIALKKSRAKPVLQDRCHAAMATLFTPLLFVVIFMTAVFPTMNKLLISFIDWGGRSPLNYSFQLFLIVIICCMTLPLHFLLQKVPFFLITMMFVVLVATFSMLMIYGFKHI